MNIIHSLIRLWSKLPAPIQQIYYRLPLRPSLGRWLLPNKVEWVRVQSGINEGCHLQLHIRDERRFLVGNYEADVQAILAKTIRKNEHVGVIGGHIGFFAIAAAGLVGEVGKVTVFEPNPQLVMRLKEHVQANGLTERVEIVEKAVSDEEGKSSFYLSSDAIQGHLADLSTGVDGEMIEVETVRLDGYFQDSDQVPSFFLIDAEHAEAKILDGMRGILDKAQPTLLIEMHMPETGVAACQALLNRGYRCWRIPDMKRIEVAQDIEYGHYLCKPIPQT